MALSDAQIKQLKFPQDAGRHFDGDGMYLELTKPTKKFKDGAKYWRMKYRFAGKENRLALGVYPEVGLKAARDASDAARKLLKAGTDPGDSRRQHL